MHGQTTVKGSQFKQPLLEFSGSCAGCAETSYARLVTQLFGDRMYISNATGCSSIWGGPGCDLSLHAPTRKVTDPAWANSLFEDNAEHGLGMYLGAEGHPHEPEAGQKESLPSWATPPTKPARPAARELPRHHGRRRCKPAPLPKALVAELGKPADVLRECAKTFSAQKEYLSKKSVWIFGGDGWAYDIGFGGVDHVLASGDRRQHLGLRYRGLFQHRRSGLQGLQHRPGCAVCRGR